MVYNLFIDQKFDNQQLIYEALEEIFLKQGHTLLLGSCKNQEKMLDIKNLSQRLGIELSGLTKNYDGTVCFYHDEPCYLIAPNKRT